MLQINHHFYDHTMLKRKTKHLLTRKWSGLCYMGILKEGFSAYFIPVMLINRKLTKDKRVETDFRHPNVRITKINLVYPLVTDTFSVLGSSKCEVLSVLDLKDAFHSLRLSENSKKYCGILPFLVAYLIYIRECPWDWNFPFYLAILYKHDSRLSSKQKILWGNYGWSFVIHAIKKVSHG